MQALGDWEFGIGDWVLGISGYPHSTDIDQKRVTVTENR